MNVKLQKITFQNRRIFIIVERNNLKLKSISRNFELKHEAIILILNKTEIPLRRSYQTFFKIFYS